MINEFEVDCPLSCGQRVKQGDLATHLKDCPEKLYECKECGKTMKKDIFKYHVAREHPDSMFQSFMRDAQIAE